MEESGADHDTAMEGSNDLFIECCNGAGASERNDQVFQVRCECFVLVDASFTSTLISSCRFFFLHLE